MFTKGPIVIVDDDPEDLALYRLALENVPHENEIRIFNDGKEALEYLETTRENPFIILCDLKMPKMTGLDLLAAIVSNPLLKKKSIPFVLITGSADAFDVNQAYELAVQGFFTKPNSMPEWENTLRTIFSYWRQCIDPNNRQLP